MEIRPTKNFIGVLEAYNSGKRRCLLEGGTSSSKTWGALQALIQIAEGVKTPILISVVSESLPHLKRGCIRDFFAILGESSENNPYYSRTEFTYKRPQWKATIEFFGVDDEGKVKGPRRQILFMNEGINIPWETARGLDIRTSVFTVVDWNPCSEYWAHEQWMGQPENAFIHSTYLDAKHVLPEQTIRDIEAYREKDPNWFHVYGLGLMGKIEGLVYPFFSQVDALPSGDCFYGLDFGFSDDPSVLVRNVIQGDSLYSEELIYQRGMTNQDLAQRMKELGIRQSYDEIWADSAEPKSIEEIHQRGFNIKPCIKGQGSVEYGHQRVRQFKHYWTKNSVNGIKEQRNFRYITDKNGKYTEKMTHSFSHAMDARRYAVAGKYPGGGMSDSMDEPVKCETALSGLRGRTF